VLILEIAELEIMFAAVPGMSV